MIAIAIWIGRITVPSEELHRAALAGDIDRVRDAIDAGDGLNRRLEDIYHPAMERTALGLAVKAERRDIVRLLLDAGADPLACGPATTNGPESYACDLCSMLLSLEDTNEMLQVWIECQSGIQLGWFATNDWGGISPSLPYQWLRQLEDDVLIGLIDGSSGKIASQWVQDRVLEMSIVERRHELLERTIDVIGGVDRWDVFVAVEAGNWRALALLEKRAGDSWHLMIEGAFSCRAWLEMDETGWQELARRGAKVDGIEDDYEKPIEWAMRELEGLSWSISSDNATDGCDDLAKAGRYVRWLGNQVDVWNEFDEGDVDYWIEDLIEIGHWAIAERFVNTREDWNLDKHARRERMLDTLELANWNCERRMCAVSDTDIQALKRMFWGDKNHKEWSGKLLAYRGDSIPVAMGVLQWMTVEELAVLWGELDIQKWTWHNGWTVLDMAAKFERDDVVKWLLGQGQDIWRTPVPGASVQSKDTEN